MKIKSVVLEGERVRLEPLTQAHQDGLCAAVADGELWQLVVTLVPHPDKVGEYLDKARLARAAGDGLAFATIDKQTNTVAGSTRFMNTDLANKRIEIGYTFLGQSWQRSPINTEAKLLMLSHAFEVLDMNRVEFKTDYLNSRSRQAIMRLGAKEEGVLRNHVVMPSGRVRDSAIYSIIKNEWPGIKQLLTSKLD